ncbi:hypothetical protein BDV59DRAFT_196913 [Aspergillus ambiguus]|uniref:uncharacterized protein n=1 Tax=Aspergillus ambiguus TaxID=176160 RepID=UPI003CCDB461
MLFTFIDSLKGLVKSIKGNPVRRNDYLLLYRQPNYGQVRCISPCGVPEDWKCIKALRTSHRVENEPLRTSPFINYMDVLYGYEIKTIAIKPPIHCPQSQGRETLIWGLRRIVDAITSIEADDTLIEEKFLNGFLSQIVTISFIWSLIRAGKYEHLARYSGQDGEEPTYGNAVYYVFPGIDSKNRHRFVSRDCSEY